MNTEIQDFQPLLAPRVNELTFWLVAVVFLLVGFFLRSIEMPGSFFAILLGILALLQAIGLSVSNWMDRKTVLRLRPEGIMYQNGLQHIDLSWEQIQGVEVVRTRWNSRRVFVLGNNRKFHFQTLARLMYNNQKVLKYGFEQGDYILAMILKNCEFEMTTQPNPDSYYYSRK